MDKDGLEKEKNIFNEVELIFQGEYKNGQRWNGKGKEYDKKSGLIFQGEYKNGQRWNGIGIEHNYFNNLIFEGQYQNGKKLSNKFT